MNEAIVGFGGVTRGGSFRDIPDVLGASIRQLSPADGNVVVGFRVGSPIPEPGTGLLVMAGMLGLAASRKRHA